MKFISEIHVFETVYASELSFYIIEIKMIIMQKLNVKLVNMYGELYGMHYIFSAPEGNVK